MNNPILSSSREVLQKQTWKSTRSKLLPFLMVVWVALCLTDINDARADNDWSLHSKLLQIIRIGDSVEKTSAYLDIWSKLQWFITSNSNLLSYCTTENGKVTKWNLDIKNRYQILKQLWDRLKNDSQTFNTKKNKSNLTALRNTISEFDLGETELGFSVNNIALDTMQLINCITDAKQTKHDTNSLLIENDNLLNS